MKLLTLLILIISFSNLYSQSEQVDSNARKAKELLESAKVQADKKDIRMTIRNVDITNYPIIKLIVEAYNIYGASVTRTKTLFAEGLYFIFSNAILIASRVFSFTSAPPWALISANQEVKVFTFSVACSIASI